MGCAEVSKASEASGVPVGLGPYSIQRKSCARRTNSSCPVSLPSSSMAPFSSAWRAATACGERASSHTCRTRSPSHRKSRVASTVPGCRKSRNDTMPPVPPRSRSRLRSGTMTTESRRSRESCVSTSNERRLSTSSPKKSMRKGYSDENENTSTMLPRTAYCPGS